MSRDHNGERGGVPICTGGRLHDPATIPLLRELAAAYAARRARRRST